MPSEVAEQNTQTDGKLPKPQVSDLVQWLRKSQRQLMEGISVIVVLPGGKLSKKKLFANIRPEYLMFRGVKSMTETCIHLRTVLSVEATNRGPEFDKLYVDKKFIPKQGRCMKINLDLKKTPTVSMVFQDESVRRSVQFFLRVIISTAAREDLPLCVVQIVDAPFGPPLKKSESGKPPPHHVSLKKSETKKFGNTPAEETKPVEKAKAEENSSDDSSESS